MSTNEEIKQMSMVLSLRIRDLTIEMTNIMGILDKTITEKDKEIATLKEQLEVSKNIKKSKD